MSVVDRCKPKCPAPCHRKTKGLLLSIYFMLLCQSFISVFVTPWIVRHSEQWMLGSLVMLESGWAAVLLLTSLGLWSPVSLPGFTALQGIVNPLDFVDSVWGCFYFLVLAFGWFSPPQVLLLRGGLCFYTALFYFLALVTTSFSFTGARENSGNLLILVMVVLVIFTQPTCTVVLKNSCL